MSSISEFFAMGGYAGFVWPAFAVTTVVMVALVVLSRRALRANEAMLESLQAQRRRERQEASADRAVESESDA